MPNDVGAAIICYNDSRAVESLLRDLDMQSYPLSTILIVDNSPLPMGIELSHFKTKIEILNFSENIGFSAGMSVAFTWASERKLGWIWLFDQDSSPDSNALKKLRAAADLAAVEGRNVAILSCSIADGHTGKTLPGFHWAATQFSEHSVEEDLTPYECDAVLNSGSLVKIDYAKLSDLPSPKFFIDGIDFIFCYNLRRRGFRILVVPEAKLLHHLGNPTSVKVPFRKSETLYFHLSPLRIYCICRNFTYLELKYSKLIFLPVVIFSRLKHCIYFIVGATFAGGQKSKAIRAALVGTLHGFLGEQFWPPKPSWRP